MEEFFVRPRVNVIESSQGYSVEVLGRVGLRYTQGERNMDVDSEVLVGQPGMMVYTDTIRAWNPPHEAADVTEDERRAIVDNIRRAFAFDGFEIEVQDANAVTDAARAETFRWSKPFKIVYPDHKEST